MKLRIRPILQAAILPAPKVAHASARVSTRAATSVIAVLAAILAPVGAFADDTARPYAFSGSCSSQGLWTQQALQTTQSIRAFTMQMKNDPNCTGLASQMQASLTALETLVQPNGQGQYTERLAHIHSELEGLRHDLAISRTNATAIPNADAIRNTMASDLIQQSAIAASDKTSSGAIAPAVETAAALASPELAAGEAVVTNAMAMGAQFNRASQSGLRIFNQVIDHLPQAEQCLVGGSANAGQLLAATVKMLTSFAASGQDQTGSQMATAISKLTMVMQQKQFSGVLRELNQADFLASMSCLVEMSTENYCTTRDSKLLFDEMMKQLRARPRSDEQNRLGVTHPLAGYYILTQNLPLITDWIQRVQIGVDPRLPTDATFQNRVFDEVNNFFKKMKELQGSFSMDVDAMKVIPDIAGRQNAVRTIVQKVTNIIGIDAFGQMGADSLRNFFTLKGSGRQIPFMLMGMDMPDAVKGIGGVTMQDPFAWLEANYSTNAAFSDPDALIEVVRKNLNEMIKNAKMNATEYYKRWFIVDKLSLVNESLLGTNYTVKESFAMVSEYLAQVEKRLNDAGGDRSIIASIQETRTKIRRVLNAYDDLERLSNSLKSGGDQLSAEDRDKILVANVAITSAVYDEFEVLTGKSGWFSNRIVKFVYADYLMMLKKQNAFGENIDDLFYASGLSLFDQILMSASGNPAKVQNDLSLALRLNKMNIDAVEHLVGGYFAATTANLKEVVKASQDPASITEGGRTANPSVLTYNRAFSSQRAQLPGETQSSALAYITATAKAAWEVFKGAYSYLPGIGSFAATQPQYVVEKNQVPIDDEFGSARRLYQQFCIQSLAFGDVRMFYAMCRGATLPSPFADTFLSDLDEATRSSLSADYDAKLVEARENPQLNLSKRICAFRDYNRKNLVTYLTSGQRNKH